MAKMGPQAETPIEWVGKLLNVGPAPVLEALFGPLQARVLHVAVSTGLLARLAKGPADSDELAAELGLTEEGARLLCECLGASGHVERHLGRWTMSHRARRWLDPDSEHSVVGFVAHTADYWDWWARLEDVVRGGRPVEIHDPEPGDPAWRTYIEGQFELARLSGHEVARAVRLPRHPTALLDVGGGHGWYAAEICRRHKGMTATVLDLPGSAEIGREIMQREGMADRVTHVEGDLRDADLGGPYDGALMFNIAHHLSPEENVALLERIHGALKPHGTVAILDLFSRPPDAEPDSGALLGMFFYLTSGSRTYSRAELTEWLVEAGFNRPHGNRILRIPSQTLYQARRRD